jgi:hypothetical protein
MARFYGKIGFAISNAEGAPGVFTDSVVEKQYTGSIIRATRQMQPQNDNVNDELNLQNSISIVADSYVSGNLNAIRYVSWQGTLWKVVSVQQQSPRLLLTLGGVYNGPTP